MEEKRFAMETEHADIQTDVNMQRKMMERRKGCLHCTGDEVFDFEFKESEFVDFKINQKWDVFHFMES